MKGIGVRMRGFRTAFHDYRYRTPIKFGGRALDRATILDVAVVIEDRRGRTVRGHGSIPLGNIWSWPSRALEYGQTLAAMKRHAGKLARLLPRAGAFGHPVELAMDAEAEVVRSGLAAARELGIREPMPKLCALVTASPFDAAVHDAYGKLLHRNAYNCLGKDCMGTDISRWLGRRFRGEYLDRYTLRRPRPEMPLYHLVGALDPLSPSEVARPVGDGLPEHLGDWVRRDGLTHLKVKLNGDDLDWDFRRVCAVDAVATGVGTDARLSYSLDFNERCRSAEYLLEFIAKIAEWSPRARARIQYVEQPTARDLGGGKAARMHRIARLLPVVIDESLTDHESLLKARELGYSGAALKACKGQSHALLMAAAAQKYGMFLSVQDLTCPGESFLHSAGLAARIPGVAAIEGNARQYFPAGSFAKWKRLHPEVFRVLNGRIRTARLTREGLGH